MIRKIALWLLAAFVLIQFVQFDKSIPENLDSSQNFYASLNPGPEIKDMIDRACMDCHSYQNKYPWYAYVAPVSFFVHDHINEAREHLNFDEWATYSAKKADHKLEECIEYVESGEMPLESYVWMHPEAELTDDERSTLIGFFREARK